MKHYVLATDGCDALVGLKTFLTISFLDFLLIFSRESYQERERDRDRERERKEFETGKKIVLAKKKLDRVRRVCV